MKKALREEVYQKYEGHCAYCGDSIEYKDMQVDHIIPKVDFVPHVKMGWKVPEFLNHLTDIDINHIDNLNPSCRVCNKWKSFHSLEDFRKEIEFQIERLNKYSSNYRLAKKYNLVAETMPSKLEFYFEMI